MNEVGGRLAKEESTVGKAPLHLLVDKIAPSACQDLSLISNTPNIHYPDPSRGISEYWLFTLQIINACFLLGCRLHVAPSSFRSV